MLFSSREVAEFINKTFEPAWESVRPAPIVTIDFGNGHVVRRTLQGNIATYVCGADGTVYDVLPGIYTPDVYRRQLAELKTLADVLRPMVPRTGMTEAEQKRAKTALTARLREYHAKSEAKLTAPAAARQVTPQMQSVAWSGGGFKGFSGGFAGNPPPGTGFGNVGGIGGFQATGGYGFQPQMGQLQAVAQTGGAFKGGGFPPAGFGNFGGGNVGGIGGFQALGNGTINGGFQQPQAQPQFSGIEGPLAAVIAGAPKPAKVTPAPAGALASRPELKLDTEVNERVRRKAVHAHLARAGLVQPNDLKKWLFKEVLHADLDDPKLGLGALLDSNYPFAEEDRALKK